MSLIRPDLQDSAAGAQRISLFVVVGYDSLDVVDGVFTPQLAVVEDLGDRDEAF